jgi:tryptophan synthase beta chain
MIEPSATHSKLNYTAWPDESGHFGPYGGKFVPETLMPALDELEEVYLRARATADFQAELDYLLRTFVGRPTPITFARTADRHFGGPRIYIKREDLATPARTRSTTRSARRC